MRASELIREGEEKKKKKKGHRRMSSRAFYKVQAQNAMKDTRHPNGFYSSDGFCARARACACRRVHFDQWAWP